MSMIKLTPFGGMIPKLGKRLLPNEGAEIATNIKIQSGELRPLRNPGLVYSPATPKNALQISIFNARNGTTDQEWFTWPIDVDCVRVPLATDVESRFCWTGDGPPKMATYTNAVYGGGHNYPLLANELMLGIPTPQTAPGVSPSGGVGSTVTRFYRYTFFSQYGEESAPSPVSAETSGKVDATWAISLMDTAPVNSGTGTAAYGSVTTFTTTAAAKHWLQVGDEIYFTAGAGIDTTLLHTVASVPSATTFTVTGNYANATAWARKTNWNVTGMTKRLYRTTGTTGSWQLVNVTDIAVATTTYNDTLTDAQIAGDELISETWIPPPVGLHSLCVHPSGALCGISGNLLCFSEPLQPHAWPEEYQLSSGYNGVGAAVFGTSVVMATAGMPFVATGVEPATMTGEDVQGMYPCLSKRSVISIGNAVLYSSLHGLVQVGAQGVGIFTDPWYTRDEWELLNPDTMICATANGRVYVAYTNDDSLQTMLVFDGPNLTAVGVEASELYADVSSGELYITTPIGISSWDDPLEVPMQTSWRSKDFVFPAPINVGAGKVEYDLAIDPSVRTAILASIATIVAYNEALIAVLAPQIVTITIATPGVFTVKDSLGATIEHGYVADSRIVFATTGALPTGVTAGTTYYVSATSLTTTSFKISATLGGAVINTSGSQSGAHTVMWIDADIGGAFDDDDYIDMDFAGSDLLDPPDTPASNIVTVSLFTGDTLLASRVVESTRVFRLPSGYKHDVFSVQVTTQCVVKEIRLSETADGLRVA